MCIHVVIACRANVYARLFMWLLSEALHRASSQSVETWDKFYNLQLVQTCTVFAKFACEPVFL